MSKKSIFLSLLILLALTGTLVAVTVIQKKIEKPVELKSYLTVFHEQYQISSLFDDGEKLWAATGNALVTIDHDTGDLSEVIDDSLLIVYTSEIQKTYDGLIWCGHNDGVNVYTENGEKVLSFSEPAIAKGRVNTICPTADGVWLGSLGGATYLTKENGEWQVNRIYTKEDGLRDSYVSVIKEHDGAIWFGTYLCQNEGGLAILKDDRFTYISLSEGLVHRYVNSIVFTDSDTAYVGVGSGINGGLCKLTRTDGSWRVAGSWGKEDGLEGEKVRFLFEGQDKTFFITTEMNGMTVLKYAPALGEPIAGEVLTSRNGLADDEVKYIVESDHYYWFAGKYGLTRMDKAYGMN